jgi:acetyltransferase-like isoleucine patch superfamily enzyme
MTYLTEPQLKKMGFKFLGKNVKISDKASIYNSNNIEIGDYSRIDDFCIVSGNVRLGRFNHITPMCLIAGGEPGIYMEDFCTVAYGVKIFAQSDDYSGETMTNSLVNKKFKNEKFARVTLRKHVIIGAGSIVFPGVELAEGCSVGAMTLISKNTKPWGIYVGNPARRIKERKQDLLDLEALFFKELHS